VVDGIVSVLVVLLAVLNVTSYLIEEGSNLMSGIARNIALYHHGKYSGGGYPFGLRKMRYRLSCTAVMHVYNALRSRSEGIRKLWESVSREETELDRRMGEDDGC